VRPLAAVLLGALALGCGGEGALERDTRGGRRDSALGAASSGGSGASLPDVTPSEAGSTLELVAALPGDDAPERIIEIGALTNSPAPPECVAGLPARLPNCSLDDYTPRGLDCDGDGLLDHRIYNCDVSTAERTTQFAGAFDCEPADPGLRYWVSLDADGDGFPGGPPMCAGPRVPAGYVLLRDDGQAYDCDDSVGAVHPGAGEVWGDGFDADCSSTDFPACGTFGAGAIPPRVLATNGCSDGPDLYLSSIAICGTRCRESGSLFGFVGNSGAVRAPGPIRLGFRSENGSSGQLEVSRDAIEPGAATGLFEVPFSFSGRLEIWVESSDCAADNQQFALDLPGDPNAVCLY
jgi:hypothetical protein